MRKYNNYLFNTNKIKCQEDDNCREQTLINFFHSLNGEPPQLFLDLNVAYLCVHTLHLTSWSQLKDHKVVPQILPFLSWFSSMSCPHS